MRALLFAVCVFALTGCIPVSLHSVCGAEDAYFDPQFVGTWADPGGVWQFEPNYADGHTLDAGEDPVYHSYTVWYTSEGQSSHLTGTLTEIAGVPVLDLTPYQDLSLEGNTGGKMFELLLTRPLHTWLKIAVVDGKLAMAPVDLDWLNHTFEANPDALPHIYVDDADWPLVTATTEELRAFIAQHMQDEGFFGEMSDMARVKPVVESNANNGPSPSYDQTYRNQTTAPPRP